MVMLTAITTIMTTGMITTMTMTIIMSMAMGTGQAISTMARVPPGFRSRA